MKTAGAIADEGSTADEGAPARGAGWTGTGPLMQIGSRYTRRDQCTVKHHLAAGRRSEGTPKPRHGSLSRLFMDFSR